MYKRQEYVVLAKEDIVYPDGYTGTLFQKGADVLEHYDSLKDTCLLYTSISLSWRSVADIERGYRGTSVDILMDMADVLGTSVDYLLFGESRTRGENGTEFSDVEERIEGLPQMKKMLVKSMLQGMLDSLEKVEILEKVG